MTGEMLFAASLALAGGALLRLVTPRLDRMVAVTVAGLVGAVAMTGVVGLVLVLGRTASLALVVAAGAVSVLAWLLVDVRRGAPADEAVSPLLAAALAGVVTGATALAVSPVLTFDSWRFLEHGASTFGDGAPLDVLYSAFSNYPLLLVALEGVAVSAGMPFTVNAVVGIGLLGVVAAVAFLPDLPRRGRSVWVGVGVLLLAALMGSSYVLRMQLALLNSHVLVAGLYAVAVSAVISRPHGASADVERWRVFSIACAGLALARVEGLLLVALLLVAALAHGRLERSPLVGLWAVAVLAPSLWYLRLAAAGVAGDILTPQRMVVLVAAASAPVALALVPRGVALRRMLPAAAGAVLAAAVVVLVVASPETMRVSLVSHAANLLHTGGWGVTWWVAIPLLAIGLGRVARRPDGASWLVVTVGFVLLVLALGGVRHVPYRLGWGDSANRMMVHVLPTLGLLLVAALRAPAASDHAAGRADGD